MWTEKELYEIDPFEKTCDLFLVLAWQDPLLSGNPLEVQSDFLRCVDHVALISICSVGIVNPVCILGVWYGVWDFSRRG